MSLENIYSLRLSDSCSLLRTDKVRRQISVYHLEEDVIISKYC